jgi:hypothetical protein
LAAIEKAVPEMLEYACAHPGHAGMSKKILDCWVEGLGAFFPGNQKTVRTVVSENDDGHEPSRGRGK